MKMSAGSMWRSAESHQHRCQTALEGADEEDDLNHHFNSLIRSDSMRGTQVPLMPYWLLHEFLIRLKNLNSHHAGIRGHKCLFGQSNVDPPVSITRQQRRYSKSLWLVCCISTDHGCLISKEVSLLACSFRKCGCFAFAFYYNKKLLSSLIWLNFEKIKVVPLLQRMSHKTVW